MSKQQELKQLRDNLDADIGNVYDIIAANYSNYSDEMYYYNQLLKSIGLYIEALQGEKL